MALTSQPAAEPLNTEALFRAHGAQVSRWVRALAGPDSDVEDLVQEVFVAIHRSRGSFRGQSAVSTWMFGIASNLVKRHRRVAKVRSWLGGSANDVAGHREAEGLLPDAELARKQARRRVYEVLDLLNEKYRVPLILFELEGRSGAEIAELMNVKESVVWVWLTRARAQFHQHLEALEAKGGTS